MQPLSAQAQAALRLLGQGKNVLISGPPGVGKTRLLLEVAEAFSSAPQPMHHPRAAVPIPDGGEGLAAYLPSPHRQSRKVFSTVMNQNSRYRHYWREVEVDVGRADHFRVSSGIMYRANEVALTDTGTALVIIDEINRGPAVQVFGPSITAIEADKRLDDAGDPEPGRTASFELLDDDGTMRDYSLSAHLYLLGAMNQADTSVEGLDVAFLRRFERFVLVPDYAALASFFGLSDFTEPLPNTASDASDVFRAAVQALRSVNERITLGRGPDYVLGHGVFMRSDQPCPAADAEAADAVKYVETGWRHLRKHVDELFFGNAETRAAAYGAFSNTHHPFQVDYREFAGVPAAVLRDEADGPGGDLYQLLRHTAATEVTEE